jgi:excisionase family DNA binding protein
MSGQLLTAEQVAELIGMTPDYVYALSRRGRIPTITFGRTRRYRRESIEQWLDELERGKIGDERNGRAAPSTPPARHRRY